MTKTTKHPASTIDHEIEYQNVRVINRVTGQPTTISIERITYIRLCRSLRSINAVNDLARKMALEMELEPGRSLSAQVAQALTKHAEGLRTQSA